MSRYNTQVLSNIRMLCRMQNIDEKVLYERAKLISIDLAIELVVRFDTTLDYIFLGRE